MFLAEEVAGVLAPTTPLGMPSRKVGHHPGWKEATLQGSATTMPQAARLGSNDVMLSSFVKALFLCGRSGLL